MAPYLLVRSFTHSDDGTGALLADVEAYSGDDIAVPGMHKTLVVPAYMLAQMVASLPAQPTMNDAYAFIAEIAGAIDSSFSRESLDARIAANEAAKAAADSLAQILAQFNLPTTDVQVPL